MGKDKGALKRAKTQAKIDKIEADLIQFEKAIARNRKIFEEDGDIDSKEQKQLDKMEKKILKIRNKLTKLGWDGNTSSLGENEQMEIERLISKMQELIESIQL